MRRGKDGNIIGRGNSKGKRLIMLHAITKDGPLVTEDEKGFPITDFTFGKGKQNDTAYTPTAGLTAELLWTASQHSGDCKPP